MRFLLSFIITVAISSCNETSINQINENDQDTLFRFNKIDGKNHILHPSYRFNLIDIITGKTIIESPIIQTKYKVNVKLDSIGERPIVLIGSSNLNIKNISRFQYEIMFIDTQAARLNIGIDFSKNHGYQLTQEIKNGQLISRHVLVFGDTTWIAGFDFKPIAH